MVLGIIQIKKIMNQDESYRNHPVWDVYDEFRTARLNVRYYELRLKTLSRFNSFTEWILAISASSSVAGLWFWENEIGGYAWKLIGAFTALLAVARPTLNLTNKIKMTSEMLSAHKELDHDFNKLKRKISTHNKYDELLKEVFEELLEKKGDIIKRYTDGDINDKLIIKCEQRVNEELPADDFYIPKEDAKRGVNYDKTRG